MLLQDWIDQKLQELRDQKYREVEFKDARECKLTANTWSFNLFGAAKIPLDAKVTETRDFSTDKEIAGVMVDFKVLKPRKRKYDIETYRIALAN